MKRAIVALTVSMLAVAPAAAVAQLAGMPNWNNPKGGTGIRIDAEYGGPNTDAGGGSAYGARGTLGLGSLSFGLGFDSWTPTGSSAATSWGATGAFRILGGSLMPVSLNLQAGYGNSSDLKLKTYTLAAGLGVNLSIPGITLNPWVSAGERWHDLSLSTVSNTTSNFGWVIGADVGLGIFGIHAAYDSESKQGGGTAGVLGIGAHVTLNTPGL
ncbi:MAG TPA: hypothetical protein VMH88_01120 [Gemmatimonadales bacterium]|nr:hypothetical protein [Gemmatimonadales bacterium]